MRLVTGLAGNLRRAFASLLDRRAGGVESTSLKLHVAQALPPRDILNPIACGPVNAETPHLPGCVL